MTASRHAVTVLGAGAWGTAVACHAARRHAVMLWCRDGAQAEELRRSRLNRRYLPGIALPDALDVSADWDEALAHVRQSPDGLVVIATPVSGLRDALSRIPSDLPVVWLCKGFEATSGALGHEMARELRPNGPSGVLSGPSFALEVARQQPTALVVASDHAGLRELTVRCFHDESLRVYSSADPVGVEVGGAVKNVLAIATGILDGLAERAGSPEGAPGLNARAALITRGLAEMSRLGVALGARPETFMGLSGLGDLVLTATGALSRNRQIGLKLAQGLDLAEALASLGHVAEGVYTAATVHQRALALGVDMPITQAVVDVLEARLTPQQAIHRLMGREARPEL
jgi:glycerol-3-phosphate dehydrogenase (NAD(P)+)